MLLCIGYASWNSGWSYTVRFGRRVARVMGVLRAGSSGERMHIAASNASSGCWL